MSGFAINDDAAIVGGGMTVSGADPASSEPSNRLWMLRDDSVSELPDLPAEGAVEGLSGAEVGDTIVVGGIDCLTTTAITSGVVACGDPRTRTLWTMQPGGDSWTRHELDDVEDPAGATWRGSEVYPGDQLRVFGTHDDRALVASMERGLTRFLSFDPSSGSVEVLGEAPTTLSSIGAVPFCAGPDGSIFQLRSHLLEPEDSASGPFAIDISVARLSPSGEWSEGPAYEAGDPSRHISVHRLDIECLEGREPIVSVTMTERLPGNPSYTGSNLVVPPILLNVVDHPHIDQPLTLWPLNETDDLEARALASVGTFDETPDKPELHSVFLSVEGELTNGDVLVRASAGLDGNGGGPSAHALYRLDEDGDLSMLDHFQSVHGNATIFAYGNRVGTVDFLSGELEVREVD